MSIRFLVILILLPAIPVFTDDNLNNEFQNEFLLRKNDSFYYNDELLGSKNSTHESMPESTEDFYNREFQWNSNISQMDYFLTLCPNVCYQQEKVSQSNFERCSDLTCFPCDCIKPRCLIYGTCCPEVQSLPGNESTNELFLAQLSPVLQSGVNINFTKKTLKCSDVVHSSVQFLLVSSCPDGYSDVRTRQWCEDNLLGHHQDYDKNILNVRTRVSDPVTRVNYYNRYCAECNNVTEVVPFQIVIDCFHYLYVYKALDQSEFLRLSLDHRSKCQVKDQMPDFDLDNVYAACIDGNSWYDKVIDKCNVTGQWTQYNPDVERLCSQTTELSFIVERSMLYFANVFCAICNSEQFPFVKNVCQKIFPGVPVFRQLPFTMLLNFRGVTSGSAPLKIKLRACPEGSWPGPGNQCFPILCTDGKLLKSGSCVTASRYIRGLGYWTRQVYTFSQENISINSLDLFNFTNKVSIGLKQWFVKHFLDIATELTYTLNITFFDQSNDISFGYHNETDDFYPSFVLLDLHIIARANFTRDEAEKQLSTKLFHSNITLSMGEHNLTLEYIHNPLYGSDSSYWNLTTNYCIPGEDVRIPETFENDEMWDDKQDFLRLTELMTCPYVKFNKTIVKVEKIVSDETSTRCTIQIDLKDLLLVFTENTELTRLSLEEDGAAIVCVELLNEKLEQWYKKHQLSEESGVFLSLYVITVVCLGMSMACLLLTIITYISFKTLRSVSGMHTLFLSATLLLAQALLLTISHIQAPSTICTILSVSAHYMWLCMFTWSFLCCFNMYTIFTAKSRNTHNTAHSRNQFIKRVAFSLFAPAVIVSLVITADYFTSNGQRMGYGINTCFLNSVELIACSMAAPLGIVLLGNIFFFISSVSEIYKVKKLQSPEMFKKSDRSDLYIYIKLSTMTGIFWLLALLAEGLDYNLLRYVSVVMNGLQGLFIFMSYVCHKRVWKFYKECCSQHQLLVQKGTLSQIASEVQAHKENI